MAKPAKKPAIKKGPKQQSRAMHDMEYFHRMTDWRDWWEEFFLTIKPDGGYKYKTVRQFAVAKAKNYVQRDFLCYYLGPVRAHDPLASKFAFIEPVDWGHKRRTGGWFSTENIDALAKSVWTRIGALERTTEFGNRFVLRFAARITELARRIDEAFIGSPFIEGVTLQENVARAGAYFSLQGQLIGMLDRLNQMYASSNGINPSDAHGLAELVAMTSGNRAIESNSPEGRVRGVLTRLTDITLLKAAKYDLPLPSELASEVIDVEAEPVPVKKKTVQ
jgi:hypothetical protein